MPRFSDQKRDQWFAFGVEALVRARANAPRVYGCPLCLGAFGSPEALSPEHVPPKAIGGKPLVLTCRKCNNSHGHLLDANVVAGRTLQEVAEGKREAWVKLELGGNVITAKTAPGDDAISMAEVPGKSDPRASAAFRL